MYMPARPQRLAIAPMVKCRACRDDHRVNKCPVLLAGLEATGRTYRTTREPGEGTGCGACLYKGHNRRTCPVLAAGRGSPMDPRPGAKDECPEVFVGESKPEDPTLDVTSPIPDVAIEAVIEQTRQTLAKLAVAKCGFCRNEGHLAEDCDELARYMTAESKAEDDTMRVHAPLPKKSDFTKAVRDAASGLKIRSRQDRNGFCYWIFRQATFAVKVGRSKADSVDDRKRKHATTDPEGEFSSWPTRDAVTAERLILTVAKDSFDRVYHETSKESFYAPRLSMERLVKEACAFTDGLPERV